MDTPETYIDIIVSFLIIVAVTSARFNEWTQNSYLALSGKPSDYISGYRYRLHYLVYLFTAIVLISTFHSFPSLFIGILSQFADIEKAAIQAILESLQPLGQGSVIFATLLITALLNQSEFGKLDANFRGWLHQLARTPKEVKDYKKLILNCDDCWQPSENEKKTFEKNHVNHETDGHKWRNILDRIDDHRENHSIGYRYYEAYCLLLLAEQKCDELPNVELINIKKSLNTYRELSSEDPKTKLTALQKENLDYILDQLIEIICKYVVKSYDFKPNQHEALKNLGFSCNLDQIPIKQIPFPFFSCILAIAVVSGYTVWFLQLVIIKDVFEHFPNIFGETSWHLELGIFMGWFISNLICFSIAFSTGLFIKKYWEMRHSELDSSAYLWAFLITLLASFSFVFLRTEGGPDAFNTRGAMALSYALFSPLVILMLSHNSVSNIQVLRKSNAFGLGFATLSAPAQALIYFSFIQTDPSRTLELDKLIPVVGIGALKGYFTAFLISYIIQSTVKLNSFYAQRASARVIGNHFFLGQVIRRNRGAENDQGEAENQENEQEQRSVKDIKGHIIDLSRRGLLLECNGLRKSDIVTICFKDCQVRGRVVWRDRNLFSGRERCGVSILESFSDAFEAFLRRKYGECYA